MNFLFFVLLVVGFIIYYELKILKIIRICAPEIDTSNTDLYKRLQLKDVLNKDDNKTKETFTVEKGMKEECPYDFQDATCIYDNILKKNMCKKLINGYYYDADESCCIKDCLNEPVNFSLNKSVYKHPERSATVANLSTCSDSYNTPTKNGELEYAGFYYCYDDSKRQCVRKPRHLEVWKNTCGNSTMTSGPLPVFDEKTDCMRYRAEIRCLNLDGSNKTEEQCMSTSYCGWCNEGDAGKGKCVPGTPIGPNDITLKCYPNVVSNKYTYRYGNTNPFILDPFLGIA